MSKFFLKEQVFIEIHENFQKQSYRNRFEILTANGLLSLSIPLIKSNTKHSPIKDIKIDYATDWQKQHFKAIESAYNSSPFYEFIMPDFAFVFEQKETFLLDLNLKIFEQIAAYISLESQYHLTEKFNPHYEKDYRQAIHPKAKYKKPDYTFFPKAYYQTFKDKFDFVPNLSVLDLLFNEGAMAKNMIKLNTMP